MMRRSAIVIRIVTSAFAHVSEKRQGVTTPGPPSCGTKCLVPAFYGACPSNDALCLCKTPAVVQAVGNCVLQACAAQSERTSTFQYMLGVCQSFGVNVPIPSTLLPFFPSTLSPSPAASSTSTPTGVTNPSNPSGPNIAAIVGTVIGIIAAMFIGAVVFICWRRRKRRARSDTRFQGARPRGMLGRVVDWRRGFTLSRVDTVSSWFVGREEKDDSNRDLLPKESLSALPSQQSSDSRIGHTSGGVRPTTPVDQLTPPPPPPSHLKPNNLGYIQEDWMRRTSSPAPPVSLSGNPFATPPHSRTTSYDLSDRYFDGDSASNNLPSTATSTSTPFSGGKPFLCADSNRPLSSDSGPGGLQEKQLALSARESRVPLEGNVLQSPARAIAATLHSSFSPISPEMAATGTQRQNLTLDTTNLRVSDPLKKTLEITDGVPEKPKQRRAHDTNLLSDPARSIPNTRVNSISEDDAAGTAALQRMFTCDTPLSDYEMHESVCGRFQTTPTDGCEELRSPAEPESATMEMFGIGFGAMGGKWEPRNSESNWSTHDASLLARLPSKKTKKGIRTPLGPMRIQHSIERGASVLSTTASSSHGPESPSSPGQRSEMPSGKSPYFLSSGSKPTQVMSPGVISPGVMSPGTMWSLPDVNRITPGPSAPQLKETISEVDADVPRVPAMPMSDGDAPTSGPSGEGGTSGSRGSYQAQELAQRRGVRPGSNLTPRTAPPRRGVVPDGFSEEGSGLSSEDARRWL